MDELSYSISSLCVSEDSLSFYKKRIGTNQYLFASYEIFTYSQLDSMLVYHFESLSHVNLNTYEAVSNVLCKKELIPLLEFFNISLPLVAHTPTLELTLPMSCRSKHDLSLFLKVALVMRATCLRLFLNGPCPDDIFDAFSGHSNQTTVDTVDKSWNVNSELLHYIDMTLDYHCMVVHLLDRAMSQMTHVNMLTLTLGSVHQLIELKLDCLFEAMPQLEHFQLSVKNYQLNDDSEHMDKYRQWIRGLMCYFSDGNRAKPVHVTWFVLYAWVPPTFLSQMIRVFDHLTRIHLTVLLERETKAQFLDWAKALTRHLICTTLCVQKHNNNRLNNFFWYNKSSDTLTNLLSKDRDEQYLADNKPMLTFTPWPFNTTLDNNQLG